MTSFSLTLDEIYALAHEALLGAGANEEQADAVANVVTRAERDGSHSHGLFRIPGYVASLRSGKVKGGADPTLSKRSPVVLHCDGDLGYAPLAHRRSLTAVAEAAKENGLATLSLTRTHHFAALWPETETLGQHGLVAMACGAPLLSRGAVLRRRMKTNGGRRVLTRRRRKGRWRVAVT